MEIPNDFYTTTTLFSLSGSATAVWLITGVITQLIGFENRLLFRRWLGFLLSIALSVGGVTLVQERTTLMWVVAIVNGFLIYATAVGVSSVASGVSESLQPPKTPIKETGTFGQKMEEVLLERWW